MSSDGMSEAHTINIASEGAMTALGVQLAERARPGDVIALKGDLGAGKSVLARGFVRAALGDPDQEVPSPTFTLVQVYECDPAPIWHFDLYRLEQPAEIWELGLEEALDEGISLIEWPEQAGTLLPSELLLIKIEAPEKGSERIVTLVIPESWKERLSDVP